MTSVIALIASLQTHPQNVRLYKYKQNCIRAFVECGRIFETIVFINIRIITCDISATLVSWATSSSIWYWGLE